MRAKPFFEVRSWRIGVHGETEREETKEFFTLGSALRWLKQHTLDPRPANAAKRAWAEYEKLPRDQPVPSTGLKPLISQEKPGTPTRSSHTLTTHQEENES